MVQQIEQRHLDFLESAKNAFSSDKGLYTFRDGTSDDSDTLIALRYGIDRDCILIYELKEVVTNFVQQIKPAPIPRESVMNFAFDMEKQLKINEHKGGWNEEHWCDLVHDLESNLKELRSILMLPKKERKRITKKCANITNYAMMIAENEGGHL